MTVSILAAAGGFMRKRVVVTGVGSVNPMGHNVEEVWSGLKEGKSGVGFTTIFDASKFPTKISAEVKNWDVSKAGLDAEGLETPRPAHQVCRRSGQAGDGRIGRAGSIKSTRPGLAFTWAAAKGARILATSRG